MLLIHGARSLLARAKRSKTAPDRLRAWALEPEKARGHNKAAVALASKLARIAWAVATRAQAFTPTPNLPRSDEPLQDRAARARLGAASSWTAPSDRGRA
jgi:hypothetical protein